MAVVLTIPSSCSTSVTWTECVDFSLLSINHLLLVTTNSLLLGDLTMMNIVLESLPENYLLLRHFLKDLNLNGTTIIVPMFTEYFSDPTMATFITQVKPLLKCDRLSIMMLFQAPNLVSVLHSTPP